MDTRKLHHAVSAMAVAVCLSGVGAPVHAQEEMLTPPQDFTDIVAELSPSVVGITARGVAAPRRTMPEGMPGPFGNMPGQQAPEREVVAGGPGL
ncbi:hypothetical protein ACSQ76_05810 [Roseovarius sp. B08]|uniref:hypothetical protein n=1 Tax=Roseovarius sp. B08 TaxID=3449223 RepID=UPI003EDB91D1